MTSAPLDTMLKGIGEIQSPLPAPVALLVGIAVFVVMLGPTLYKITMHAETVVHESAHALAGLVTGRRIQGVTISRDGTGATDMVPKSGLGYAVAAFVGYVGASAAGLIAAGLISIGHIVAVLWLGLLLLSIMLLIVRKFFGGIVILVCGALLVLIMLYTTAGVETAVAYVLTWFLLMAAPKRALGVASKPKDVEDATILAGMTLLWPSAWCFLWLAGTIAALVFGGAILV
jgi:Peptidase M50B-like